MLLLVVCLLVGLVVDFSFWNVCLFDFIYLVFD